MPLAILQQVKDLPLTFTLDDSMAMSPAARLSSAQRVVIGARISKHGDATTRPGDLQGLSAPIAPGARGLKIEITEVVGP
jgi:cytochrome c-type biogenesis protein CcmH